MLTNMSTIRKSIERLVYLEGIEKSPEFKSMSKKELAALDRERQKLERNLQGIRNMGGAPDAMVPSAPTMKTSPSARPTA